MIKASSGSKYQQGIGPKERDWSESNDYGHFKAKVSGKIGPEQVPLSWLTCSKFGISVKNSSFLDVAAQFPGCENRYWVSMERRRGNKKRFHCFSAVP